METSIVKLAHTSKLLNRGLGVIHQLMPGGSSSTGSHLPLARLPYGSGQTTQADEDWNLARGLILCLQHPCLPKCLKRLGPMAPGSSSQQYVAKDGASCGPWCPLWRASCSGARLGAWGRGLPGLDTPPHPHSPPCTVDMCQTRGP